MKINYRIILRGVIIVLLISLGINARSQETVYKFWVQLTDKNNNTYSVDNPLEFMSQRSINRRTRHKITITEQDLPVSRIYLDSLAEHPLKILYTSKWLNAAIIQTNDSSLSKLLPSHSFVSGVDYLYRSNYPKKSGSNKWPVTSPGDRLPSYKQIEMLQGNILHEQNLRGNGIMIAVLDGGFANADNIEGLDSLFISGRIRGTRSFVEPDSSFFGSYNGSHGTNVLSIMGGNVPNELTGVATKASYFLIQSEDTRTEFRIEEANWLAGAELADSVGADIINSSLGYSIGFTDPLHNYEVSDLDGKSTLVTRAAQIAASKGILVVASAGNSGRPGNAWGYITPPADGENVLSIGAVDASRVRADFSSRGPSYDGRIKPDVMAQGVQTWLIRANGFVEPGNGTSFSSPLVAGLAACLWQKNLQISNLDLIESIRSSSSINPFPDTLYGYGIPNFALADNIITDLNPDQPVVNTLSIHPNPAMEFIRVQLSWTGETGSRYEIIDLSGRKYLSKEIDLSDEDELFIPLNSIPPGSYLIRLSDNNRILQGLFIKLR